MDTRIFDFSLCQIFHRIDRFTPEKRRALGFEYWPLG